MLVVIIIAAVFVAVFGGYEGYQEWRRRRSNFHRDGIVRMRVPDSDGVPNYIEYPVTKEEAERLCAAFRRRYPEFATHKLSEYAKVPYNEHGPTTDFPLLSEADQPLAKLPPNVGGEGNPPYKGGNYVTPEEIAEEMKTLPHFYVDNAPRRPYGDLAWDFKPGHVAGDGNIWETPDTRVCVGTVRIPLSEQVKAARFGWAYTGPADEPGYILVTRRSVAIRGTE